MVSSRSNEELRYGSKLTSKQGVKVAAVKRVMQNIGRDAALVSKDDLSKLDKFLSTDD